MFFSDSLMAAEDCLLQQARATTGSSIDLTTVEPPPDAPPPRVAYSLLTRPQLWRRSPSRAGSWI